MTHDFSATDSFPARTWEVDLSNLMRAGGKQLDIMEVNSFNIVWAYDSVVIEYEAPGEQREREKLRELSSRMRFRRSNPEA